MKTEHIWYLIIMVLCLLLSALFSAAEAAFTSLNKTRIRNLAEKGDRRAAAAADLAEREDSLSAALLIWDTAVNVVLACLGTVLFRQVWGEEWTAAGVCVIGGAILLFGEVTPRTVGKICPEACALFTAPLMGGFLVLSAPVGFLLHQWKKLLSRLVRVKEDTAMSQEELLMLVEEVEQEGSIDTDEGELLRNVIEFTDRTAADILTPRVDLEAVALDAEKAEVAKVFTESMYSRLLVYRDGIDDIVGILHLKNFYERGQITERSLEEVIAPPIFIHKHEQIRDILKLLQEQKSQVAVVLDDYGGTLGIVTMEDILEELVGDIWDEHDEVSEDFRPVDADTCVVDASVKFEDFCRFYGLEADSECNTLGGWIMEQLDKVPDEGDSFVFGRLTVTVTEVDGQRVAYARVVMAPAEAEEEQETEKDEA